MSFCVVTLVYILVFLCGEGLTSDEIRADPNRDYNYVKRYWLRVCADEVLLRATLKTNHGDRCNLH
jgi:hypothetical protein